MFRFTIRDVLWLRVVVGLACGWGIEMRQKRPIDNPSQLRRENNRLKEQLAYTQSFLEKYERYFRTVKARQSK